VENARLTLLYMGMILGIMFIGITYLARVYHIVPEEGQTAVSLLGQILGNGPFYYFPSCHTVNLTMQPIPAADFPRLCYFGSRWILSSAVIAIRRSLSLLERYYSPQSLCCCFSRYLPGQVNAIIPLRSGCIYFIYPVPSWDGTRWFKQRTSGWQASALMNGLGAIATAVVLAVVVTTKFLGGAWLVVVAIPLCEPICSHSSSL